MTLKSIIGIHLLIEYLRVIRPDDQDVPKILVRHFAILNYCNVRRNYQEEVDNLKRRPSYAALGVLGMKLSQEVFNFHLKVYNEVKNFAEKQKIIKKKVLDN